MTKFSLPKPTASTLFFAVCILISAATFRHSTIGFASLEGSMFWGALSALAVDLLMFLFAHAIRNNGLRASLAFGLFLPAVASIYTQLLFAVTEAEILQVAPGAAWMGTIATDIINARVVGLPALLPVLMLVSALVGRYEDEQTVTAEQHERVKTQLQNAIAQIAVLQETARTDSEDFDRLQVRANHREEFYQAVTNPEAWKNAKTATELIVGVIFKGVKRPATKVLAQLLDVGSANVSTVIRKMKSELVE